MIVLDASVALAWCFEDELSAYADAIANVVEREGAMVPAIWPLEVANGLLAAERRKRITQSEIVEVSDLLWALRIEVEPISLRTALDPVLTVGRGQGLSAYDAAYVELARRVGTSLATIDVRLRAAASAVGVSLVAAND